METLKQWLFGKANQIATTDPNQCPRCGNRKAPDKGLCHECWKMEH